LTKGTLNWVEKSLNCRCQPLIEELGARCQAQAAPLDDLDVVVGKTDGAKGKRGTNGNPDEGVGGVGPEHGGQQDGDADEHAAHRRSAGLLQVRLRPVFAHVLANLKLMQLLNHPGADEQRDQQSRQRGKSGPERKVAEDAERVKEREELFVEQPVKQGASIAGMRQVSD